MVQVQRLAVEVARGLPQVEVVVGVAGECALEMSVQQGIGLGAGLFAVSTLTAAMALPEQGAAGRGLVLGAWGAAQATAAGLSIAVGGGLRDVMGSYAMSGQFGQVMASPTFGYAFVYQIEIVMLFVTLIALGPLVRVMPYTPKPQSDVAPLGIVDFPT